METSPNHKVANVYRYLVLTVPYSFQHLVLLIFMEILWRGGVVEIQNYKYESHEKRKVVSNIIKTGGKHTADL